MANLNYTGKHSVAVNSEGVINAVSNKTVAENTRKEPTLNINVTREEKPAINQGNFKETLKEVKQSEYLGENTLLWYYDKWRDWIWPEWLAILEHPARIKVAITDRSTGKSKNTGLWLLFRVMTENDFLATLVMRNYDECLEIARPQYLSYIDTVVKLIAPEKYQGKEKAKWLIKEGEKWDSFHQAVSYAKDGKNSRERIFFITLWDAEKSKKTDDPHQQIFLEECVPTKNQQKKNKGIENTEPNNYMTIYNSIRRGTKPQQNFLGNPNMPWLELWFLNLHWPEEMALVSDWYWKNTPSKKKENLKAWREWTWSIKDIWESVKFPTGVSYNEKYNCLEKEIEGFGQATLYLRKVKHDQQPFPTDDDFSWHLFFQTAEELKYTDFINGSRAICMFEDCILYQSKRGFLFFCHKEYAKRPNVEDDENIKLYYVTEEQRLLGGNQRVKWKMDKQKLRDDWAWRYDTNKLYFCKDGMSRQTIMRFIGRGLLPHSF